MSEEPANSEASSADNSAPSTGTAVADPPAETLFADDEIAQFEEDDVEAGRAIGKMLSLLFIYTVIAMSIVAVWTYSAIMSN